MHLHPARKRGRRIIPLPLDRALPQTLHANVYPARMSYSSLSTLYERGTSEGDIIRAGTLENDVRGE